MVNCWNCKDCHHTPGGVCRAHDAASHAEPKEMAVYRDLVWDESQHFVEMLRQSQNRSH